MALLGGRHYSPKAHHWRLYTEGPEGLIRNGVASTQGDRSASRKSVLLRPSNCAGPHPGAGRTDRGPDSTPGTATRKGPTLEILKNLFGPHADRLQAALGRASRRHQVLLGNLANVSTPGFKRQDVHFNLALEEAGRTDGLRLAATDPRHITQPAPKRGMPGSDQIDADQRSIRQDGSSVDLETEIAALTETSLRYNALTMLTRRYFQGLKEVIREGR